MILGGLLALAPMSGCKLEDPEIPVEELYLRNFIKEYGLIDPTQDFSSARQVNVTLNIPDEADVVNIYAQVGDEYYRVGCYAGLSGLVTLPVDVSKATELLMLDVDGLRYYTEPNGKVNVLRAQANTSDQPSEKDYSALTKLWIDNWSTAATNNGETGVAYTNGARTAIEIDENGKMQGAIVDGYIDVRSTAHIGKNMVNENITDYTKLGEKNPNAGSSDLGDWCFNDCEVGNTQKGTNVHFSIINNDETLSAYRFTFRTASRNDAQVRAVIIGKSTVDGTSGVDVYMDSEILKVESNYKGSGTGSYNTAKDGEYTEWEVRTDFMPKGEYQLIIMGVDATENTVIKRQHCGNWGYMKIDRLKTTKDMRWILACEDLGTTDDFDFNDVVFSIEAINTNYAALNLGVAQWQVVENPNDNGFVLNPTESTGTQVNAPSRADNDNTTLVKVTALAAGGTLPIWLHFREADGKDYIVSPSYGSGNRECLKEATAGQASQELAKENNNEEMGSHCNEWHRWFDITELKKTEDYYDGKDVAKLSSIMLNTGFNKYSPGRSVTFTTSNVFSLEKFSYIQYGTGGKGPHIPEGTDEWAKKVLEWQWQQENAQEVTFGFFLTVYKPIVGENDNDKNGTKAHLISKGLEGLPPQMFLIPDCDALNSTGYRDAGGWKWPCERINITRAYPNFRAWVENKDAIAGSNWFMMPTTGIVDKDWLLFPRINPEKFPYKSQKKDSQSVAEDKTEKI